MTGGHDLTSIWQIFRQTHIIHQVVEVGKKRKKEHYFVRNFTWVKKKKKIKQKRSICLVFAIKLLYVHICMSRDMVPQSL